MAAVCATLIQGTHLRVLKLDSCGVPVSGASSQFLTEGFTQVAQEPQYEDGDEFFLRTAGGKVCVNEQAPPTLKRMQLTVDLCVLDPELFATFYSARTLTTGAPATGTGFAVPAGEPSQHYSVEVWQRVTGEAACTPGGVQRYGYVLWPNVSNGKLGNYQIGNEPSQPQVVADAQAGNPLFLAGNPWLNGAPPQLGDLWLVNLTTTPPPTLTGACGARPYP
jgi:hypothetical protein